MDSARIPDAGQDIKFAFGTVNDDIENFELVAQDCAIWLVKEGDADIYVYHSVQPGLNTIQWEGASDQANMAIRVDVH